MSCGCNSSHGDRDVALGGNQNTLIRNSNIAQMSVFMSIINSASKHCKVCVYYSKFNFSLHHY